jgi:hypothetical protein
VSSEILRRAASLMRERAEAADPSPWDAECPDVVGASDEWIVYASNGDHERSIPHIASWHPAVALAVADWLEAEAEAHFHIGDEVRSIYDQPNMGGPALAVARAYLGEEIS